MPAFEFLPLPTGDILANPRDPSIARGGVDPNEGKMTQPYIEYFTAQGSAAAQSPQTVGSVSSSTITASVATTDLATANTATSVYRLTYWMQCLVPGSVSSSLTLTFGWSTNAVAQGAVSAALNGNLTTSYATGTLMFRGDGATPITYSATYASNLPAEAEFAVEIQLERMP